MEERTARTNWRASVNPAASKNETVVSRFIVLILVCIAWASTSFGNDGAKTNVILKRDPIATSGKCLIEMISTEEDTKYWLDRYKIQTVDLDKKGGPARFEERAALASGLQQLEALWGGQFAPAINTKIDFQSRSGASKQLGGASYTPTHTKRISMNRCDSQGCKSRNVAHLMHELCHQIGHSEYKNGQSFQNAMAASVGKSCYVSDYSHDSLSEQFAENCSSFVTHPERLYEKNQACRAAFHNFFAKAFQNGKLASCSDQEKKLQLAAAIGNPGGTIVATAPVTIRPTVVAIVNPGGTQKPAPPRAPAKVASIAAPGDENFDSLGALCQMLKSDNWDTLQDLMIEMSTRSL